LYWKTDRLSKNAIQNELFIKLAAGLHNSIPGDTKYLAQAIEVWDWFNATGFINAEGLINDGITNECKNNGATTWSYNQGVIVGGLVQLFKATGENKYLTQARVIADAVVNSPLLTSPEGVLTEPCEAGGGDCGNDGPSFKGAAIRGLGELNRILDDKPYSPYLLKQVEALLKPTSFNSLTQYGLRWAGPFDKADAARQHSALEALTAVLPG
jgi:predicted alpha-1,6-mannanase (GH76 family)